MNFGIVSQHADERTLGVYPMEKNSCSKTSSNLGRCDGSALNNFCINDLAGREM